MHLTPAFHTDGAEFVVDGGDGEGRAGGVCQQVQSNVG